MKKQNFITACILYVVLLINACGSNNNKENNSVQQDSSKAKKEIKSIEVQEANTFTDSRDSKTYKTVTIGTQTWMAENLRYKVSSGCWAYDNNESNANKYGYLYNWETAKKVCPTGWHLPSDAEWTTLTIYLGGENIAGGKLKATTTWESPNTGASNSSGFTALPGGSLFTNGNGAFGDIGGAGLWWSSTEYNTNDAWNRFMFFNASGFYRSGDFKNSGFSVRCVKD